MLSLDIDQLKTFLAVVETNSFTQAGDRVSKTQSAVSMQIKKLEETLGKKLFQREGRGILLNSDGQKLVSYAREIVERSNSAIAAFDDKVLRGSVQLGTADDYADRFLPTILAEFSKINPSVEVSVICENTMCLAKSIKSGQLDVAIVTHSDAKEHSELLREEPFLWVTSDIHTTHKSDVMPLAIDLCWKKAAIDALEYAGLNYRLLCTSASSRVIGATVLAGLAVSIQPESALRPGMRVLTEDDGFPQLPNCQIGLMRGHREKTDASEALIETIRQTLSARNPPDLDSPTSSVSIESIGWPSHNNKSRSLN